MERKRLTGVGTVFLISVALVQGLVFGAAIVPSYQIQVRLDTQGHMLFGEESISFERYRQDLE